MRFLWTLAKIALVIAIGIPLCMFAVSLALGIVGTVIGLAVVAVRFAILGFAAYGLYRLGRWMFGSRARQVRPAEPHAAPLPPADPYYSAAMRELDSELRA